MSGFSSIAAVTFDLDGTLYDARAIRWQYLLRNWSSLRVVRVTRRVREELRITEFNNGADFRAEETKRVAERLEVGMEQARQKIDAALHERLVLVLKKVGPRADALSALEALVKRGIRLGVISDYAVDDKLHALGLGNLPWEVRIAADALGALKPHPRAFLAAVERLGVPPAQVLHVGDRFDTDVEGARGAGLATVLLGGISGENQRDVTCVPSLSRVVEEIFSSPA